MKNLREVASGLRFPEGPVAMPDGTVLLVEISRGTLDRVHADGRVEVVADLGGGPERGGDRAGRALLCLQQWRVSAGWTTKPAHRPVAQADDYSGGRIERVNLATGAAERLYTASDQAPLRGPNDLVFDRAGGFYFTDLGKGRAREMDRGGVYYAKADGSLIR